METMRREFSGFVMYLSDDVVDLLKPVMPTTGRKRQRSGGYLVSSITSMMGIGQLTILSTTTPELEPVNMDMYPLGIRDLPSGYIVVDPSLPVHVTPESYETLKVELESVQTELDTVKGYEQAMIHSLYRTYIEAGLPFTASDGRVVQLESLYDVSGTAGQPDGPKGYGSFVRRSALNKYMESRGL